MDKPTPLPDSNQLLDDLESIRRLLGDDALEPPVLTETVGEPTEEVVPLLFETTGETPLDIDQPPLLVDVAELPKATPAQNRQDTLLHLDAELREAARKIMQDVIDDFAPHIETEIKRRLEARMQRLLTP
ncbi:MULTISPECIES: DNA polymerase III subunit chi [Pseudomonas]|uniref:DNA polymerase III subunit chi n=1 Tax=Pseudomonas quercus TaxID=2722792 RepID=A0ABX0YAW1_9PSED|nr:MULTISPECIES: DNA polymerase III subunit chi [Pseudomonas]MBF7141833.1 DNA polymerase III subunit chi [Pseudomonas sp. LY10J]NJP00372.1 DNA polymerase III subunit chi [Pseudomonas quercus]